MHQDSPLIYIDRVGEVIEGDDVDMDKGCCTNCLLCS